MGTCISPSYAWHPAGYIEHFLFQTYPGSAPQVMLHYMHDCIGAAYCTSAELFDSISFTINIQPLLVFTQTISDCSFPFLDLSALFQGTDYHLINNYWSRQAIQPIESASIDIYSKFTEILSYLDHTSSHLALARMSFLSCNFSFSTASSLKKNQFTPWNLRCPLSTVDVAFRCSCWWSPQPCPFLFLQFCSLAPFHWWNRDRVPRYIIFHPISPASNTSHSDICTSFNMVPRPVTSSCPHPFSLFTETSHPMIPWSTPPLYKKFPLQLQEIQYLYFISTLTFIQGLKQSFQLTLDLRASPPTSLITFGALSVTPLPPLHINKTMCK